MNVMHVMPKHKLIKDNVNLRYPIITCKSGYLFLCLGMSGQETIVSNSHVCLGALCFSLSVSVSLPYLARSVTMINVEAVVLSRAREMCGRVEVRKRRT